MARYTKKILSDTLLELIKEKTLNEITVQELVDRSCMNRKTFYSHFHGIADLLKWMLVNDYSKIQLKPVSLDSWREQAKEVLQFIKENRFFFRSMYYSRYYSELHLFLKGLLTKIIDEYEDEAWETIEKQENTEIVLDERKRNYIVKFYSGAVHTLINEWFLTGMKESVDDMIYVLSRLMRNSIYNAYQSFLTDNK